MAYLSSYYGIPQNPLHGQFALAGLGCGCGGGCGSGGQTNYTLNGLGSLGDAFTGTSAFEDTFTGITDWLQEPSPVLPAVANWLFYGGLIIAADLYIGGRGKRRR